MEALLDNHFRAHLARLYDKWKPTGFHPNLKPFESGWFRTRCGCVAFVTHNGTNNNPLRGTVLDKGIFTDAVWSEWGMVVTGATHEYDLVERLVQCTGWNWGVKPKTKLQEMAERILKMLRILRSYPRIGADGESAIDEIERIAAELESMESPK